MTRHWLLMGVIAACAAATAAESTNSGWTFHAWQTGDGLPNNNVTGLAQTPDRYLWVANASKLARFDGVQFETFSTAAFGTNWTQKIRILLRSRSGGLWLGTDHGAVAFLKDGLPALFTNGLPDVSAQTFTEDDAGDLWITYNPGIIYRLKDGKAGSLGAAAGLPAGSVSSLARDNHGHIWFAQSGEGDGQVGLFRDEHFQTLLHFKPAILRLAAARSGGVWICAGFHLFKFNEGAPLLDLGSFAQEDVHGKPNVLLEDSRDALWIGTSDSGLFRYSDSHFEKVPTSHPQISDLREDREGNLWVATSGGGLNRLRRRVVDLESVEGAEQGRPFETVVSLCEDSAGMLWGATQNGILAWRSNGVWSAVVPAPDWRGIDVSCVASDSAGGLWVGTRNNALYHLKDGRFAVWKKADGLVGANVRSLLATSTGDLWLGEDTRVLQRLCEGKLQSFDVPVSVRHIRALAEDTAHNIWVGTSGGLLLRIANDVVTDETPRTALEGRSIRTLYSTPDGSVWIGYASAGLGRFKEGHFTHVTSAEGLSDDSVSQIVADSQGWLWLGGDGGIFKLKEEMFRAFADGRADRVRCTQYGRDEGLLSLQASFDAAPGAVRTRDGRLWIPMRTALAVINPDDLPENREPPRVIIRRAAMDEQTVALYGGVMPVQDVAALPNPNPPLRLPARHRRVEFDFTGLNFSAPENVHFRYRLDGADDNWVEFDTQRKAIYPHLSSGDYSFRVAACNSDGVWSEADMPLAFSVAPFFWQTWWFRGTTLIAFTLTVAAVVRYVSFRRLRLQLRELEQQAALDKERSRIARDLHDDLGGSLTEVSLLLGTTERGLPPAGNTGENIRQCSSLVQQITKSVDEIIWAINPGNDTLHYLIDYISQFVVEFLHAANIRCRVELPDAIPDKTLSPEVRHNLFLVVKEALNNSARHSQAKEVRLRIATTGDQLNISIEDTGRGFAPNPGLPEGDGLKNMRQRMDEIGGEFQVESQPQAGTRVSFVYHFPREG
jgi:signal transduction histidine kinase/ligand-binding sensor domain-containing protein